MASILSLPAELRNQIYLSMPSLHPSVPKTISHYAPPGICRAASQLRRDTLPIYISHCAFTIYIDSDTKARRRLEKWLDTLGDQGILLIGDLRLSQKWNDRAGFDVVVRRVERGAGAWQWSCRTETYPVKQDGRGLRLESVELLRQVMSARLSPRSSLSNSAQGTSETVTQSEGLKRKDVMFLLQAMFFVASRPFSTYDLELSDVARTTRLDSLYELEQGLTELLDGTASEAVSRRVFFTPC